MNMVIYEIVAHMEHEFKDEREALLYYQSILPEFKKGFPGIKEANIKLMDNKMIMEFRSFSISRLRAILNSINRWLISMSDVIKYTEVEKIDAATSS
jgi:tRNA threonylcarbamoyladenosine modification (KEOPS) complex  Pcc1 subunit